MAVSLGKILGFLAFGFVADKYDFKNILLIL
jgi:hypothetical protein